MNFRRDIKPDAPLSVLGLTVIAGVTVLDQITKLVADALIPLGSQIPLLPILSLYRVNNTGIALSFLTDSGAVPIVLMVVVTAIVLIMWQRSEDGGRLAAIGFALIIGGAVGNLIDRLRLGHVIDFLFLHLGRQPLFVFNLADAALTIGPALLVVLFLWPARSAGD